MNKWKRRLEDLGKGGDRPDKNVVRKQEGTVIVKGER